MLTARTLALPSSRHSRCHSPDVPLSLAVALPRVFATRLFTSRLHLISHTSDTTRCLAPHRAASLHAVDFVVVWLLHERRARTLHTGPFQHRLQRKTHDYCMNGWLSPSSPVSPASVLLSVVSLRRRPLVLKVVYTPTPRHPLAICRILPNIRTRQYGCRCKIDWHQCRPPRYGEVGVGSGAQSTYEPTASNEDSPIACRPRSHPSTLTQRCIPNSQQSGSGISRLTICRAEKFWPVGHVRLCFHTDLHLGDHLSVSIFPSYALSRILSLLPCAAAADLLF